MSSRVRKWVGAVFEVVIFCKTNPCARILRYVRTFSAHFTPQHLILRHIRAAFISFSSFQAKLNWKTAFYPLRPKTRVSLQELLFIPLFVLCLLANDQRLLCYCQTKLPKRRRKRRRSNLLALVLAVKSTLMASSQWRDSNRGVLTRRSSTKI